MVSPFDYILHTNHAPSDTESRQIRDLISESTRSLARMETEISCMQAIVDDLSIQCTKLREHIKVHRALLSPIRRFPPELMQEIFIRCLSSSRNPVMQASEAPVLLGRICSKWRKIALGTPELWSSIHIVVQSDHNAIRELSSLRRKSDSINAWLGRSGTRPLTISLCATKPCGWYDSTPALLDILVPHSRRWKAIDLRMPSEHLATFAHLTSDDVPRLERFVVDDVSALSPGWSKHLLFLESAPHLHSLSMTYSWGRTQRPVVPWVQLTDLHLQSDHSFLLDTSQLLAILQQCPNLRRCTVKAPPSSASPDPLSETHGGHITLPYLHTLSVRADEMPNFGITLEGVFSRLILPKLREVEIRGNAYRPRGSNPQTLVAFASLLSRSSCPLEILTLHSLIASPDALIKCLRLIPTLTQLTTEELDRINDKTYSTIRDDVVRLLTPTHRTSAQCLCPSLATVQFRKCRALSDQVLLDFLDSRWRSVPPGVTRLKLVEISLLREVELNHTESEIHWLHDHGLNIIATFLERPFYKPSPWGVWVNF